MGIETFSNDVQKRLRDILRGSGTYTSYLTHPDSSPPAITTWVIQGRPEKDSKQEVMVAITKPEPTSYDSADIGDTSVEVETELQADLFVSGVTGSGTPRSDNIRRILIGQINQTILANRHNFEDIGVKTLRHSFFDNDNPDDITERHTVFRVTFEAESEI